ncbi:hypothetical protein [Frankia sp. CiP1_Cm_nod1]
MDTAPPIQPDPKPGPKIVFHRGLDSASDHRGERSRYHDLVNRCRQHVGVHRIHHVGHFVNGIPNFSVDILEHEELAGHFDAGSSGPANLRATLIQIGRKFNYDIGRVDRNLADMWTGRLMRTIFDVSHFGVYWYWIHGNEYLVGLTLGGQHVDDADRSMAAIAESILESLGRPPRNYGGFQRGIPRDPARYGDGQVTPAVNWSRSSTVGRMERQAAEECRFAVHPADLHYVAFFADGRWQFSVDVLDSERTKSFGGLDAVDRRGLYQEFGERFQFITSQFDRMLTSISPSEPGRLVRTVLDVEAGALYHHPVALGRYVVGVTLFQDQVAQADDRIRTLVESLRRGLDWSP